MFTKTSHPQCVNSMSLSAHPRTAHSKSYLIVFIRTKALVLELLAAVCLVRGGHEIILSAFDNFKTVKLYQH